MRAQRGEDFTLMLEDDSTPGAFEQVGGFKGNDFSYTGTVVDITNSSSLGFTELLNHGGSRSLNLSGTGVFMSDAVFKRVVDKLQTGEIATWQVSIPGLGTYQGPFAITSLDMNGAVDGEVTYAVALASGGVVEFTLESDA